MAVGMLMYSFGWIGCILPAGGVGGGAAGLSLVLCNALSTAESTCRSVRWFSSSMPSCCWSPDLSWGGISGLKTIFCVVIISLGMNFWQEVLPRWQLPRGRQPAGHRHGRYPWPAPASRSAFAGRLDGRHGHRGHDHQQVPHGQLRQNPSSTPISSSSVRPLLVGMGISAVIYGYVMTAVVGIRSI